jgi:3-deoxy-D-manno-octulosonate 8-phosphate phosphatase (KDO 8-P phosphatase)
MDNILKKAAKIKLLIFDVDGVLTDGQIHFSEHQEIFKAFHVHDGLGIKLLQSSGIPAAIITGSQSAIVRLRAEYLGIRHVYQVAGNKIPAYESLIEKLGLDHEAVAYLGDDLPDLPLMQRVGLSVAVANAVPLIREHANWVTQAHGGRGAARELCELILRAKGLLGEIHQSYLSGANMKLQID